MPPSLVFGLFQPVLTLRMAEKAGILIFSRLGVEFCFDTKSEKLVEAIESAQSSARSFLIRSLVEALHFLEGSCHFGMLRGACIPFTPQSLMPASRRRE